MDLARNNYGIKMTKDNKQTIMTIIITIITIISIIIIIIFKKNIKKNNNMCDNNDERNVLD
jgi:hypothetical protein